MGGGDFKETALRVLIPVIDRPPHAGGAQTFETSILLAVDRLKDTELDAAGVRFLYFARGSQVVHSFRSLGGLHCDRFLNVKSNRKDHLLRVAANCSKALHFNAIARALARRQAARLGVALRAHCDIIWNLQPATPTDELPYVVTVWDLQHRLQPLFPEVSQAGIWQQREDQFRRLLPPATAIVAGTSRLRQELQQFYGIDPSAVWVNPLPAVSSQCSEARQQAASSFPPPPTTRHFILYPAQFWAHKNHRGLLLALKILQKRGLGLDLVLTGSDMGLKSIVLDWIDQLGLANYVHCLGFVSRQQLEALYCQCRMMCFPSFFGPDNLPPLEAMALGVPVAAADVPGIREQLGDAALFFKPSSPESIADAIQLLDRDLVLRHRLIQAGYCLAAERSPAQYVQRMLVAFQQIKPRLKASHALL